jgi:hypothetical protein
MLLAVATTVVGASVVEYVLAQAEEFMFKTRTIVFLAAAILFAGCTQTGNTPTPMTAGPMDPNSVTVFTLALQQSSSVSGCIMGDPSMTRPITLTVSNDKAELLTAGGIHYSLTRIRPDVYAGGDWIKINADLSVRPKRLTVSSDDHTCNWAATAA